MTIHLKFHIDEEKVQKYLIDKGFFEGELYSYIKRELIVDEIDTDQLTDLLFVIYKGLDNLVEYVNTIHYNGFSNNIEYEIVSEMKNVIMFLYKNNSKNKINNCYRQKLLMIQ